MSSPLSYPYRRTYWIVIAFWWAAMIVVVAVAWAIQPEPLLGLEMLDALAISLASGAVSTMAIMPGFAIGVPEATESTDLDTPDPDSTDSPSPIVPQDPAESAAAEQTEDSVDQEDADDSGDLSRKYAFERLGNAFLVGMSIRLVGTVALFLASSYYLDASPETTIALQIAAWILCWHLYLLLVEVIALTFNIKT